MSFNPISTNQGSGLIWNNTDKLWEPGTLTASITNTTTVTNSGGWVDKLATNTPSYDFFGDTVYDGNDTIYFVGGRENSSTVRNYVWGYTLSTNTWAQVTTTGSFHTQILEHAVVYYNNCIYVFGGWTGSGSNFNDLYKLDLTQSTPTWSLVSTGGSISIRRGPSVTMYNSKLIVFGGFASSSALNDVYEIDLIAGTPTWTQLHSGSGTAPSARYNTIIETYQNKFFIFSGSTKDQQCWEFDLTNNTWSQVSLSGTIPTGRVWSQHTIVDNNIYLYGGGNPTILNDFAVLNVLTGECSLIAANITVPQTRGHGLTYANNKIYLYGNNQSSTGYTFEYTIPLTTTTYNPVEINKLSTYYALSVGPNYDTTSLDNSGSLIVEGNVGIGISDPSGYKLEVAGDISFNGNLYQNGALFVGGSTIDETTDVSVNNLDVSGNFEVGSVITPASPAYTISYEYHNWDKHGGGPFISDYGSNNTYKIGSYLTSDSAPDRMQTNGLWSGASTQTFSMKDISGNNGSISNVVALFYRGTSSGNTLKLSANGLSSSVSTSQQNDTGYTYYFELRDPWTTPSAHRHPIEYIIAGTEDDLETTREFIGTTPTSSNVTEINNMNWKIICRYHFTDDNNYWNSVSNDIYDPDASQLDLSYCTVYDSGESFTDINGRNTQVGSGHNKYYYVLKTTIPNLPLYKGFCVFIIDSTASNVSLKSFNIRVEKFHQAVSEQTSAIMSINNTKCNLNLPIDISGTVKATGSITANTTITNSDDRLKHNEKYVDNAISIINKLNPMRYFKTAELKDKSYNFPLDISGVPITTMNYYEETGIIAQDIHRIPELSHTLRQGNDNVPYGIDYNSIFCTHIAATKELNKTVNDQKLIIESQQQDIETLKLINQDINQQLNDVLNENDRLKNDIQFIKNYLGIN